MCCNQIKILPVVNLGVNISLWFFFKTPKGTENTEYYRFLLKLSVKLKIHTVSKHKMISYLQWWRGCTCKKCLRYSQQILWPSFFKNEEISRVDIVQNYFDRFITSMCLIYLPSLQYSRPSLLFGQPSCLNLTTVLPQHLNHYHEFSSNLWPFDARHKMEWNQLMVDTFSWNIHLVFVSFWKH